MDGVSSDCNRRNSLLRLTYAPLAVPSFVVPGTVADNVRFLYDKVDEVGLCFFETQSCLAYTAADFPHPDAIGNLRFHVHLPLDLPWPAHSDSALTARETALTAYAVFQKAAPLSPYCAVLHPPPGNKEQQRDFLASFVTTWRALCDFPLLLENTPDASIADLGEPFLQEMRLGFCLDTGHMLAYNQLDISDTLLGQTRLVHWCAPGATLPHRHLPLTSLTVAQHAFLNKMAKCLPLTCVHMLEIFSWNGIIESLPVLEQILDSNRP